MNNISDADKAKLLEEFAKDTGLLEIARKEIEDQLLQRRDSRLSLMFRGNGLVIREPDGKESALVRMSTEEALMIGLEAMAKSLDKKTVSKKAKKKAR